MLSQDDSLKGLQAVGKQALVGDMMQTNIQSADVNEPLQRVLERLQSCHCPLLSATKAGQLVGIVNIDNIMELIKIQTALQEGHEQTKWQA